MLRTYPYFDATTNDLALEPMLKCFGHIPAGRRALAAWLLP